ncbi:MAG: hypothetical protein PHO03_00765, partial [Candidatus Omnitrophica bacterium]|nr:hypothetical protein [Candidatus Omnitrophota bacterium]
LVRAANTGVSGFIDPQGRVVFLVGREANPLFTSGYKSRDIFIRGQPSFYKRHGDFLVAACLLFLLFIAVFNRKPGRRDGLA